MIQIEANMRRSTDVVRFRARSFKSGIRTAARRLGVSLAYGYTLERVGSSQWSVTGDRTMVVVLRGDYPAVV